MTNITEAAASRLLDQTLAAIEPPKEAAGEAALSFLSEKIEGASGLGELRPLFKKYMAARGRQTFEPLRPAVIIACADHGVARAGVSAYPPETTREMARNYLIARGAAANVYSDYAGASLYVADLGMNEGAPIPGLLDYAVARGTKNIAEGPAMTEGEAAQAIAAGIELANLAIDEGANVLLPGEMGISNTTSQAALAAALCRLTPEEATGRGTNISDERLARKVEVVRQALKVNGFLEEQASLGAEPSGTLSVPPSLSGKDLIRHAASRRANIEVPPALQYPYGEGCGNACHEKIAVEAQTMPSPMGRGRGGVSAPQRHVTSEQNAINKAVSPLTVAARLGGFELLALAGLILGGAARRVPTILDGANTAAGALIAAALCPEAKGYLLASHLGGEKSHAHALKLLGLKPLLFLDLKLSEAAGSSIISRFLGIMLLLLKAAETGLAEKKDELIEDKMPRRAPAVTDRTFDFYLNTMPAPDKDAMQAAERRLLALTKPPHSLGHLETLAAGVAGVMMNDRPPFDPPATIILISPGEASEKRLTLPRAFARSYDADLRLLTAREEMPLTAYFAFGREKSEEVAFDTPLIVPSFLEAGEPGTLAREMADALLAQGELKYAAEELLTRVPKHLRPLIACGMGAILAAAHNGSLVIPGDQAMDITARYLERLVPDLAPYVLHERPLMRMGLTAAGGAAGTLSLHLVEAALSALANMKTFQEAKVSTSMDTAGQG